MAKKITCPVCMTKMRNIGHDLVCPECGYKYCGKTAPYTYDGHDHNQYQTYSQKTTYTGSARPAGGQHYQNTAQGSPQPGQNSAPRYQNLPQNNQRSVQPSQTPGGSRQPKKSARGKIIFVIVLIYIITSFGGALISLFFNIWEEMNQEFPDFQNFSSENTPYSQVSEPPRETEPERAIIDFSVLDPFGLDDPSHQENTYLQQFVCSVFSKEIGEVTAEDCGSIRQLYFYPPSADGSLTVSCVLQNSTYDEFTAPLSAFDTSEFRAFYNIERLDISALDGLALNPGDLDGLNLLTSLICANSPEELADIISPLQLISLTICQPDSPLSLNGIEEFRNLTLLSVTAGMPEDADCLAELQGLYNLTLSDMGYLSDFTFLSSLINLRHLELNCPSLSDISFLQGTPQMTTLSVICSPGLTDLSPLENCPLLDSLYLSEDTGIRDFTPIGKLTNLTQLFLCDCGLEDLEWITGLEKLNTLVIPDNKVTSLSPLSGLPELSQVYCFGNSITDYGDLDPDILNLY